MTRTSDSSLRKRRGFTLLELLVVMLIVGLLAALVAPNLQRLVGSIDRATRRDGLVADIAGLGHRAFAMGQSFEVTNANLGQLLRDGSPVIAVPSGWRVSVERPIQFGFNGMCSGGRLTLISPDGVNEPLRLRALDCAIERG